MNENKGIKYKDKNCCLWYVDCYLRNFKLRKI